MLAGHRLPQRKGTTATGVEIRANRGDKVPCYNPDMANKYYVTASELGEYVYCECCWWEALEGRRIVTAAMEQGTSGHSTLARDVDGLARRQRLALLLVGGSLLLLVALLLIVVAFRLV